MKISKTLLIMAVIFSFSFIGTIGAENYKIENEKVFYNTGHDVYELISEADASSFETIYWIYAKDKNNVYYTSKIIEGADPTSFATINNDLSNNLSNFYSKDKDHIFCRGEILAVVDLDTFMTWSNRNSYAKDKNNVYNSCEIINGVDVNSFEVLDRYGKDKNNVYWGGYIVKGADANSFIELEDGYGKDSDNYFYGGKIITSLIEINAAKELEKNGFNYTEENYQSNQLFNRLKGNIILKVEEKGEAYYLNPSKFTMHYLGRPNDAFFIMKQQGVGITNSDLEKIPVADNYCPSYALNCDNQNAHNNNFAKQQHGKILLQIEANGEAWYVNPNDSKRYFLGRPADAFSVMRNLGLGISNNDFINLTIQ